MLVIPWVSLGLMIPVHAITLTFTQLTVGSKHNQRRESALKGSEEMEMYSCITVNELASTFKLARLKPLKPWFPLQLTNYVSKIFFK